MADEHDELLRGLVTAMLAEAPEPDEFFELRAPIGMSPHRRPRRAGALLIAAGVIVAAAAGAVAFALLLHKDDAAIHVSPAARPAASCFPNPGLHVASNGAQFGPFVSAPAGGTFDLNAQPDYISVACPRDDGIVGYVKKSELFTAGGAARAPVYNDGATALVGHLRSPKGFVPLADTQTTKDKFVIPLAQIPEGVSARAMDARTVFMVRHGRSVVTFLTDPYGTPGLRTLWWCPKEEVFIEPAHAGAFDTAGRIIGGPATRGLDRLVTKVQRGTVIVAINRVVKGSTARYDRDPRARTQPGNYDLPGIDSGTGPWNSGPESFCSHALIGG